VNDASTVTSDDRIENLFEKMARQGLFQSAPLRDEIEQILRRVWTLENNHPGIATFQEIQHFDRAGNFAHVSQQADFQRNQPAIELIKNKLTPKIKYFRFYDNTKLKLFFSLSKF
jgi:hypothetical protein